MTEVVEVKVPDIGDFTDVDVVDVLVKANVNILLDHKGLTVS